MLSGNSFTLSMPASSLSANQLVAAQWPVLQNEISWSASLKPCSAARLRAALASMMAGPSENQPACSKYSDWGRAPRRGSTGR